MKNKFTLLLFLAFFCAGAFAANHVITFSGTSYSPNSMSVTVGDTVTWQGAFSSHPLSTTTIPGGAQAISNVNSGTSFSYVVLVAGTYNYRCGTHGILGMTGTFTATAVSGLEEASGNSLLPLRVSCFAGIVRVSTDNGAGHENYDIRISNILGETIWNGVMRADEENKEIEIADQPRGVYVISLADARRNNFIRKFSIQ